ncbi:hypothetical protein [Neobacillus sp. CF12]|uniref:hypothetical protein n=1 Tax=Neobacillus sp. CF12 TaxID=3055864 RepID=UPI0025A2D963|nr:hypothetical protein [Neobacillus sp. CF12]MDM5326717.1 hypothetical protein [Neobacillus sp. CF12]
MPLESCKDQKSQTLIEFYTELSNRDGPPWNKIGNAMLKFIQMINEIFKETKIFGLTSHANLNLLSKNEYTSTWHVSIQASVLEGYHISHKDVKLFAKDIIEAKEHLLNAMIKSNGWPKSEELKRLQK